MRVLIVGAVLSAAVIGCASPPPAESRSERLLSMAASEAGQVADPGGRLRRQLRVADRQVDDGRQADARSSLAAAAATLRDPGSAALSTRVRIAGWVSVSQLSRGADDSVTANTACDAAVAALRSVSPAADRSEYAVGVAREVRALRGKPDAARLLAESAGWATAVADVRGRHAALAEIADELFTCEDYSGGLAVLRTDPDPAWRSDTLARLSDRARSDWSSPVGNAAVPGSVLDAEPRESRYGQSVDFQSVFGGPSVDR